MAKSTLQVLVRARELIAKGFTQGSYATGSNGDDVDAMSDDATCFCTLGALARVEGFKTAGAHERGPSGMYADSAAVREITQTLIDMASEARPYLERLDDDKVLVVPAYNDQATQEQVLRVFDITINRVKEK